MSLVESRKSLRRVSNIFSPCRLSILGKAVSPCQIYGSRHMRNGKEMLPPSWLFRYSSNLPNTIRCIDNTTYAFQLIVFFGQINPER